MSTATKEKMLNAAINLFYMQGFDGTSVRHIAEKAKVNVALVSYYFGGKKGLFEELMMTFFEGYLAIVESEKRKIYSTKRDHLSGLLKELLIYQQQNHHLARLVHREMTLDSTLVRELMSTYLRKEKHEIESILRKGIQNGEFKKQPLDMVTLQIRHLIIMPYLYPHYLQEINQLSTTEPYFIKRYMEQISLWIDKCLGKEQNIRTSKVYLPLATIKNKES
ncbi:forespore capture DNA-binding protein RefZ [Alkalihalobacillus sp. 1P02AB]|uniref:forespore capture DNA-binding protein RefZ n=1 Tax=Alkalihalobacillus sp. 1P02AB TaxID=3132260 RepID=UPI0039A5FE70